MKRLYPFHIDAWVALPDHMHYVWTLPPDSDDFPVRRRLIKLLFSKGLPRTERVPATRRKRAERGVWQRRYWEHTVSRVQDWPCYSFHRYVHDGILTKDWCGDSGDLPTVSD